MTRLKIYVAGPYSGPDSHTIQHNTNRAVEAGIKVMLKGHHPYIPHLTHYICMSDYCPWPSADRRWVSVDSPWVVACDALLLLAHSRGADTELALAQKLGKTIFYSIDEIPDVGGHQAID
jgi:hypothetical protein